MKFAVATALLVSAAATTTALAQDGMGHGPPKMSSVVFIAQADTASQPQTLASLFKPKSGLGAPTK
ncbi:MAG: hypothetical protein JSR36_15780 [Proteobacteria bacterium]|nr:hypothetical protein [Pseudomonadota bacterium]